MKEFIKKIIRELEESKDFYRKQWNKYLDDDEAYGNISAYDDAIKIVNKFAEEYNNGWIPCSEKLPEVEADVLVSLRSLDVYTGFRANTEGCFYVEGEGYVEFENVLAWQPLLEPYKELTA